MRRSEITAERAAALVADQFPAWAHLPVTPVAVGGNDNRTFRLGSTMLVRLPSHAAYVAQVEKEQAWLPWLAPKLPCPIPAPLAFGRPSGIYPHPWSVYSWLPGQSANIMPPGDKVRFAADLANFLHALRSIAPEGPPAGPHSHNRGGDLWAFDEQTRAAIATLGGRIRQALASRLWDAALAAPFAGPPVWVHGDIAPGNLLVEGGRLSAVIDYGCCAVGDPACDLVMAWTYFDGDARASFQYGPDLDDAAWARGRGWALWKALIILAAPAGDDGPQGETARTTLIALGVMN